MQETLIVIMLSDVLAAIASAADTVNKLQNIIVTYAKTNARFIILVLPDFSFIEMIPINGHNYVIMCATKSGPEILKVAIDMRWRTVLNSLRNRIIKRARLPHPGLKREDGEIPSRARRCNRERSGLIHWFDF